MREALAEAEAARDIEEVPAGAVLAAKDGRIIGRGHNRVITFNDPTAHAEMSALRAAAEAAGNYRLTGSVLYSTLEPCPMCLMAAIHARVARVVFGAAEPKWGAAGSLMDLPSVSGLNHNIIVTGGLLAEECARLISSFFKEKREKVKAAKNRDKTGLSE
ncbi:tRNA adenosine(34) deaminase TadA [Deltaproteobacteria bacterium Smac51]|nr:tRNA adenosine(34) deaminase TadA [Deltaproteobacteria bacterium Smac51]